MAQNTTSTAAPRKGGSTSANVSQKSGSTATGHAHAPRRTGDETRQPERGVAALRQSPVMAHLLGGLESGQDIGHYGQLTFAMVARHFLDRDEMIDLLGRQPGMDEAHARGLLHQVEERDYSPPGRDRLLEWQRRQDFPLIPEGDDASANLYRDLNFPERIYDHINEYHAHEDVSEAARPGH